MFKLILGLPEPKGFVSVQETICVDTDPFTLAIGEFFLVYRLSRVVLCVKRVDGGFVCLHAYASIHSVPSQLRLVRFDEVEVLS